MNDKAVAVLVLMGSDSDLERMRECLSTLDKFGVGYRAHVSSAHRSPERTAKMVSEAKTQGFKVIIAAAGMAAHLAGVAAANTTLPVIGVPLDSGSLRGMDALLSTVMMPAGVPVACVALGTAGAKNAAILAVQILALSDAGIADKLEKFKSEQAASVEAKDRALADRLRG